jgi:DNA (cytosine-5)-methyltransferase 1
MSIAPKSPRRKAAPKPVREKRAGLRVIGLFAGIGGIELGMHQAGHRSELFCEIEATAQAVLRAQFENQIPIVGDIRELTELPEADLVTAGFPCQDLSQAGRTAGIRGDKSGLVGELFRLLEDKRHNPKWLLLENVPFMLQLHRGHAMEYLTDWLENAGFSWAYRVVDAQSFGIPQRRRRVLLLASRTEDPRAVLYRDDAMVIPNFDPVDSPCGFYWTEGNTGLGWAVDAVPTLKGGSTIGIPSPPAIWMRHLGDEIVQPDIRDAERLQGFPADWTAPAVIGKVRSSVRWKLVGNAVSVPMAKWLGECLNDPVPYDDSGDPDLPHGATWPRAAWCMGGRRAAADLSLWPVATEYQHLAGFLQFPTKTLSHRASSSFYQRLIASSLRTSLEFREAIRLHVERTAE